MSYSRNIRGTDAFYADELFTEVTRRLEDAADNALTIVEQLGEELEEKENEIAELEEQVELLEEKLVKAANTDEAGEFLRVLRNVQVYVADHIQLLEKKYGEGLGDKTDKQA